MKCFQATGQGFTQPSHGESFLRLSVQQHTFSQINSSCAVPCWQSRYVLVMLSDLSKWAPLTQISHRCSSSCTYMDTQALIIFSSASFSSKRPHFSLSAFFKESCLSYSCESLTSPRNSTEQGFVGSLVVYRQGIVSIFLMV